MSLAFDTLETPSAEGLNARLRAAHPAEVIAEARDVFGERLALVSSFGAESAVLLHLAAQVDRAIPILFLDTGMLFAQTLDYRRRLADELELLDVRDLRPKFEDLALHDPDAELWRRDTGACCTLRKVAPLDSALADFDAWITGRKRFHGGERVRLPVVEAADRRLKFNPLANWTPADLRAYAETHALPAHPLVAAGFPSIGCWPCTERAEDGAGPRSGRWVGSQKTECGIHSARAPGAAPFLGADL